jgi:glutamine phosphoribosylpyrophosphate amidotransferase
VFKEGDLSTLEGHIGIGHTRYSTTGSSTSWENAQPMLSSIGPNTIALAHNGNLVNTVVLRDRLKTHGIRFRSTTDSEVMATLINHFTQEHQSIRGGIREAMTYITGAYAVVMMTEEALYAFRDPNGVRPLLRDMRARHRRRDLRPGRRAGRAHQDLGCRRRVRAGSRAGPPRAVHVRVRLLRPARLRDV